MAWLESVARTLVLLFNWRVCLDISLIAAGFFLLYHTLRATGTVKIVVGVLLAIAVFLTANVVNLRGIQWIFANVSNVALIGLIVVFQPEIRKAFERAASLHSGGSAPPDPGLAALFAEATFALAGVRRGALVVLPGKEPIKPWTSAGVLLDAAPTLPLLLSIFDPHSPGHDGAVVAEGGRLASFGVRLPLSQSGRISEALGTRHHAALGLSEVTDALVIAVSEERGAVTTFRGGAMRRAQTPAEIASAVESHWRDVGSYDLAVEYRKRKWTLIREGLVSFGAAILFWATVILAQMRVLEATLTVPIEYTMTPSEVVLVGERPSEMKVHLSGPASDLERIAPAQLPVRVDLSHTVPGRHKILVTAENLALPASVQLLDTDPERVEVTLKAMEMRQVPVRPRLVGSLPAGARLGEVDVSPKRVQILAPEGEPLPEGGVIYTHPIDLSGVQRSVKLTTTLNAPPTLRPGRGEWPEVKVRIQVVNGR